MGALVILAILVFLSACTEPVAPGPATPNPPQATAQPMPTPQPGRVIYALIDRSSSYQRYTSLALERLIEVLPMVMSPGDRVIAAWIGSKSGDPAETFLNEAVPLVDYPQYPPEIDCPPAFVENETTMQKQKRQQELRDCLLRQEQRNQAIAGLTAAWEQDCQNSVQQFLDQAIPKLRSANFVVDDTGTHIYEAIYQASQVLPSITASQDSIKRKLLVLSDMQEFRATARDQVSLNLSGVDVVIAMFDCPGPGPCEQLREEWTKTFFDAQASSVDFLVVDATLPETLARLLLR